MIMQFDGDDTRRIGKVLDRVKEPSSLAGIALLLSLFGMEPSEAQNTTDIVINALVGVFSVLTIFVPEKAKGR